MRCSVDLWAMRRRSDMEKLYSIICHTFKRNALVSSDVVIRGLSLESAIEICPKNSFVGEFSLKYIIE